MSVITAKYTESHNRLTVNIKFPDGSNIRLTESRSGSRLTGTGPLKAELFKEFGNKIVRLKSDEAPVDRCKRLVAAVEGHSTIEQVLAANGAAPTPAPVVTKPTALPAPMKALDNLLAKKDGLPAPSSSNAEIAKAIAKKAKSDPVTIKETLAVYVLHHALSAKRQAGIQEKLNAL